MDWSNKHIRFIVVMLFCVVCITLFMSRFALPSLNPENSADGTLPDFSTYSQTEDKKEAFFHFLSPIVLIENRHILKLRNQLLNFQEKIQLDELSGFEIDWVMKLANAYQVNNESELSTILSDLSIHVDMIPQSLVMSQAAIESGWGTSRFAKQGNNLFGQWCFRKGCGIVPQQRGANEQHEVASFDSINESIRAYMKNLNSLPAYKNFRDLRADARNKNDKVKVGNLIQGLEKYSEQGQIYISKVGNLIRQNNLEKYD